MRREGVIPVAVWVDRGQFDGAAGYHVDTFASAPATSWTGSHGFYRADAWVDSSRFWWKSGPRVQKSLAGILEDDCDRLAVDALPLRRVHFGDAGLSGRHGLDEARQRQGPSGGLLCGRL